jgi:hypothetical protein
MYNNSLFSQHNLIYYLSSRWISQAFSPLLLLSPPFKYRISIWNDSLYVFRMNFSEEDFRKFRKEGIS